MPAAPGLALCIVRYPLVDASTLAAVRRGLETAPRCIVVLRDSFMPRSPRHPLTWEERARAILHPLSREERARVVFAPMRERYDADRTAADLRALAGAVASVDVLWAGENDPAVERVISRDGGWRFESHLASEPAPVLQARLFASDAATAPHPIPEVDFARLRAEWRQLAHEKAQWSVAPYPVVLVTVDAVITAGGSVLLIERGRMPGQGLLALPGGFLDPCESIRDAALRELEEETHLAIGDESNGAVWRAARVFDHPRRSQRGRVITHAFHFDLGEGPPPAVHGGDDAASAEWVPVGALAQLETRLHDDHFHILTEFLGLPLPPLAIVPLPPSP